MTIQECYKKMGADYQEVLGRLHNEAMIGKFVRMFSVSYTHLTLPTTSRV